MLPMVYCFGNLVLQPYDLVNGASIPPEASLVLGEQAPPLHEPLEPTRDHLLHCLAQSRGQRDRPIRSRDRKVLGRLWQWKDDGMLPIARHGSTIPDAIVYPEQDLHG